MFNEFQIINYCCKLSNIFFVLIVLNFVKMLFWDKKCVFDIMEMNHSSTKTTSSIQLRTNYIAETHFL